MDLTLGVCVRCGARGGKGIDTGQNGLNEMDTTSGDEFLSTSNDAMVSTNAPITNTAPFRSIMPPLWRLRKISRIMFLDGDVITNTHRFCDECNSDLYECIRL